MSELADPALVRDHAHVLGNRFVVKLICSDDERSLLLNKGKAHVAMYSLYGGRPRMAFQEGFLGIVAKVEARKRILVDYFEPASRQVERAWVEGSDYAVVQDVLITGKPFCGRPTFEMEAQLLRLIFSDQRFAGYARQLGNPAQLRLHGCWHKDHTRSLYVDSAWGTDAQRKGALDLDRAWRAQRGQLLMSLATSGLETCA